MAVRAMIEDQVVRILPGQLQMGFFRGAHMSVLQAEAINQEIGFSWHGDRTLSMTGRLFVIHTYNSLLIKLLAAEIVSAHGLTTIEWPAQAMSAMLNDGDLLNTLKHDIERAGIFIQAGIKGFIEEIIFSWYLDVSEKPLHATTLLPALRGLLATLSMYRTDHLHRTRDVLRDLYQGLVPGKLRQSLGEFYTPDWLVDFTIQRAQSGAWLDKRVLDPTCGSGAFLVAIIRLMRQEASSEQWDAERTLAHICHSVWGFDLNPLAVQTARVNFLMEIADLLRVSPGSTVEIPVLLADAIYSPAPDPAKGEKVLNYKIGSQVAKLDIDLPADLVRNRSRLDHVFSQMEESVEDDLEFNQAEQMLLAAGVITAPEADEWRETLRGTYNQVLSLHRHQWNGIWFRVVRNFFWSFTAGRFDCIVGNPPWVRWSKLPDAYRERVKPTCESYDIFSKTKRHGGNELDISAMITYTTSDKWLKTNGRLAFVIRGELFKNPSSTGFRKFRLPPSDSGSLYLQPLHVDDMKALKPFEDATNHTTVVVFAKSTDPVLYPVPYTLWAAKDGSSRSIPPSLPLADVMTRIHALDHEAAPVNEVGSPWAVLARGRFERLRGLALPCSWTSGHKGITPDLNGLYYVPILGSHGGLVQVRTRPEAGSKPIGDKKAWVEPTLIYPLIKGPADFEACYIRLDSPAFPSKNRLYTFVPNQGIKKADYTASENEMNGTGLRKTKAWFAHYKQLLLDRSTYRRQMKGAPFYAVYNVGEYTFKPWKVIWPEMMRSEGFFAAVAGSAMVPVVGERPYVPDHKIYFSAFDTKEPAYFLCGLLNTWLIREWIESHNIKIQVGNVFKHLRLPEYKDTDPEHVEMSNLVEMAHSEHDADQRRILLNQVGNIGETILTKWMEADFKD
jgi:hypothetical protein